jgi:hypothetical protein
VVEFLHLSCTVVSNCLTHDTAAVYIWEEFTFISERNYAKKTLMGQHVIKIRKLHKSVFPQNWF